MEEVVQMWEVNNSIVNIHSQQLTRDGPLSGILRNVMTVSQMVESILLRTLTQGVEIRQIPRLEWSPVVNSCEEACILSCF